MTSSLPPSRQFFWPAIVCALAGCAVFQFFGNATHGYIDTASMFYWWGFQWLNPTSETEHGWLILALSVWLLWRNLRNDDQCAARREEIGRALCAMAAGLALNAAGFVAQQTRVSIAGFLIFTWGVLALAGGRRWARAAAFPLGFMLFAVPVNVLDTAGFWLRMWVVDSSATLAHVAGIEVVRSGTQLLGPDGRYQYDVAAACSGVRSLTALAALSLLIGYLNFRSVWRRALPLLLCLPLTYFGNVARIASIIFSAQLWGPVWGERAHMAMGYGVFLIVVGGVFGAVSVMQRWWPEGGVAPRPCPSAEDRSIAEANGSKWRHYRMASAVVLLAVGEMFFLHHLAALPPRGATGVLLAPDELNPVELPAFLGIDWTARPVAVTTMEREILPPDTGFSRKVFFNHLDPSKQVFLSIVLSGRDRTSIHRPELCLVGQGWTITGARTQRFAWPGLPAAGVTATLLRVERAGANGNGRLPALVAYWFVSSDTVAATHWERFLHDAWNRLRHGRADRWAYVLIQTDSTDGEPAALARMQNVLNATLPAFQKPFFNK